MPYFLVVEDLARASIGPFETEQAALDHFKWTKENRNDAAGLIGVWADDHDPEADLILTPEEDKADKTHAQPLPKPSYYRVLVSEKGSKFFRTSRLHSARAAMNTYQGIKAGFVPQAGFQDGEIKVEVLEVLDDGSGHVLTDDQLHAIVDRVLAEMAEQGA